MGYYKFKQDSQDEQRLINFLKRKELDTKLLAQATKREIIRSEWMEGNHKEFDQKIFGPDEFLETVEWKLDKLCISTGNCYVEYWCRGKDSGLNVTEADLWAQVVFSNEHRGKVRFGVWRTEDFRKIIKEGLKSGHVKDGVEGGDKWKGGRAAVGYLVKEAYLFGSEYTLVDKTMDIAKFIQKTGIFND